MISSQQASLKTFSQFTIKQWYSRTPASGIEVKCEKSALKDLSCSLSSNRTSVRTPSETSRNGRRLQNSCSSSYVGVFFPWTCWFPLSFCSSVPLITPLCHWTFWNCVPYLHFLLPHSSDSPSPLPLVPISSLPS